MLRETDVGREFERLTRGVHLGRPLRVRQLGWMSAATGVGLQVAGVVVLAYAGDPGAPGAGSGGGRAAGHALLLGGVAVAALGALLALAGPWVYTDVPSWRRRLLGTAAPVVAIVLVAAGVVALQRRVIDRVSSAPTAGAVSPASPAPSALGASTNPDVNAAASIPDQPLDAATRATLADQLTVARRTALAYPTVADALRAGMYLAGGFAPGSGAHYMSMEGVVRGIKPDGTVDPRYPASFIYDGTSPTSRIVGLMYISLKGTAPEGFAGPNDHWHRHFNVCVVYGGGMIQVPFPADADVTRAQCDAVHGEFMQQTVWMVHTWVVPGWESPQGVFSHANIDLRCADGTFDTDSRGFCKGT